MDNKLYRIEVLMHDNLPTIDTMGTLITNEGLAVVKLHPVKLKAKPTVDAVPVVHGRWMWGGWFKACSVCGTHVDMEDTLGAGWWNYCPNCGSKMDGDKHE